MKGSPEWIERYADVDVIPSYADYGSNKHQDIEINIVRYVREDIHENLKRDLHRCALRIAELQESNQQLMQKMTGGKL